MKWFVKNLRARTIAIDNHLPTIILSLEEDDIKHHKTYWTSSWGRMTKKEFDGRLQCFSFDRVIELLRRSIWKQTAVAPPGETGGHHTVATQKNWVCVNTELRHWMMSDDRVKESSSKQNRYSFTSLQGTKTHWPNWSVAKRKIRWRQIVRNVCQQVCFLTGEFYTPPAPILLTRFLDRLSKRGSHSQLVTQTSSIEWHKHKAAEPSWKPTGRLSVTWRDVT